VKNVEQTIFIIDFHVCHGKASTAVDMGGGRGRVGRNACQPLSEKGHTEIRGRGNPKPPTPSPPAKLRESGDKCYVRLLTIYQHVAKNRRIRQGSIGDMQKTSDFQHFPSFSSFPLSWTRNY